MRCKPLKGSLRNRRCLYPNCSETVGKIYVTEKEKDFIMAKTKELAAKGRINILDPDCIGENGEESLFNQIFTRNIKEQNSGVWASEGTGDELDILQTLLDVYHGKIKIYNLENR